MTHSVNTSTVLSHVSTKIRKKLAEKLIHEKPCTCPGSNRRPLACEASVITTTLQVPTR